LACFDMYISSQAKGSGCAGSNAKKCCLLAA